MPFSLRQRRRLGQLSRRVTSAPFRPALLNRQSNAIDLHSQSRPNRKRTVVLQLTLEIVRCTCLYSPARPSWRESERRQLSISRRGEPELWRRVSSARRRSCLKCAGIADELGARASLYDCCSVQPRRAGCQLHWVIVSRCASDRPHLVDLTCG